MSATLYGPLYGAAASSGGGSSTSPALGIETTAESIRDRAIAVISSLVARQVPGDKFYAYRNEGGADFQAWCEANPADVRRRFQVRRIRDAEPPDVSNADFEERLVTFRVLVAYPQTHRDGIGAALDRDDAMDADMMQIEHAIGMCGRANFAPPYPDACWRQSGNGEQSRITEPIVGRGVDFVQIFVTYQYRRAMT